MRKYRFVAIKYLPRRIATSFFAIIRLLYFKPMYLFLAAGSSVLFYEIIFWFLNLGLAQYLLVSPYLTVLDKFDIIVGSYSGIFGYPLSGLAIMLFLVSVLQGITISAIVYSIRHERESNKGTLKSIGGTGIAGLLSVFGLGCAACGTSLVTPILTFLFASSSVAMTEKVGLYAAVLALIVAVITTYLAGLKLAARLETHT